MAQRNSTLDEFYASVNHQFSLIINKLKSEDYSTETLTALIENYRNRALDVFIRGLNGELSRVLIIQKPQTLPEAYATCLEIQNLNYRNISIHRRNITNTISTPVNQIFSQQRPQYKRTDYFVTPKPLQLPQKNLAYNLQHQYNYNQKNQNYQYRYPPRYPHENNPPPRPTQPKPPVPMDISVQSRNLNYINRPSQNNEKILHPNDSSNIPLKRQRVFNTETKQQEENYLEEYKNDYDEEYYEQYNDQDDTEVNFTTKAYLAYHT